MEMQDFWHDSTHTSGQVQCPQTSSKNQGSHFGRYLRGKACCFCEHVEVSACEGESDWLLHLDGDGFLLLVHVGGLGQLDVAHPNVSGGGELNSLLGAGDDHGLSKLGQIADLREQN